MNNLQKNPNKLKLLFGISSSIIFVLLGIYLYTTKSENVDITYSNFVKITAIACIIFFGITGFLNLKKLLRK